MFKTRPRKTVEDYLLLPEGQLAELIHGELLSSPSPKLKHQLVVSNLHLLLRRTVDRFNLGVVIDAPMDVHLPTGDVVQPDLIFVSRERQEILQDWIRGAPDLVIEVLSTDSTDRDCIIKRDLYARSGIQEYWIVDGEARAVEVMHLAHGGYRPGGYFEMADTITSVVLKDLQLRVADIFQGIA